MKRLLVVIFLIVNQCALQGQITFEKDYGSPSTPDIALDGCQTADGGYLALGILDYHNGGNKVAVLFRLNEYGDTIWTRKFINYGIPVFQKTSDDGALIIRTFRDSLYNIQKYFMKIASNGDSLWSKFYGISAPSTRMKKTADHGYIIVGNKSDSVITLCQIDSNFNIQWQKEYEYKYFPRFWAYDIIQTLDGGFAITGLLQYNTYSTYIFKTNSSGDSLFVKVYPEHYSFFYGGAIQQIPNGDFIIGTTNGYLIKTTSLGDTIWCKNYAYSDWQMDLDDPFALIINSENNIVVTGGCVNSVLFLAEINQIGDTLWTKFFWDEHLGGGLSGHSIVQTYDGGYFVSGLLYDRVDDDYNMYFLKIDGNGFLSDKTKNTEPVRDHLIIYPNPTPGDFSIELPHDSKKVEIFNSLAHKINVIQITNQKILNFSNFENGLYFIVVTTDKGTLSKKLIVNN